MCPIMQKKGYSNRRYGIIYIYITLSLILLIYSIVIIAASVNLLVLSLDKFEPLFRETDPKPPLSLIESAGFMIGFNFVNSCVLLWGFSVIPKTSNSDSSQKKMKQFFVFVLICLTFSLGYLSIFIVCIVHRLYIMENTSNDILYSMQQYGTNTNIKGALDKLQIYYSCCGNVGYSDWILFSHRVENEFKKKLIIPPYSCCNSQDIEVCRKNGLSNTLSKSFNVNLVWNVRGCSEIIRNSFGNWNVFLIGVTSLVAFFVQVIASILGLLIYCNMDGRSPPVDCNLEMEILSSEDDDRNNFVHRTINDRRFEWKNNYDDPNVLGYCSILSTPPE